MPSGMPRMSWRGRMGKDRPSPPLESDGTGAGADLWRDATWSCDDGLWRGSEGGIGPEKAWHRKLATSDAGGALRTRMTTVRTSTMAHLTPTGMATLTATGVGRLTALLRLTWATRPTAPPRARGTACAFGPPCGQRRTTSTASHRCPARRISMPPCAAPPRCHQSSPARCKPPHGFAARTV